MSNFTDEDYIKIGKCLKRIANEKDGSAVMELHNMFEPLVTKHSYSLMTNKFSAELNNELDSNMFDIIMKFKIKAKNTCH